MQNSLIPIPVVPHYLLTACLGWLKLGSLYKIKFYRHLKPIKSSPHEFLVVQH